MAREASSCRRSRCRADARLRRGATLPSTVARQAFSWRPSQWTDSPLHTAVHEGDSPRVAALLRGSVSVNLATMDDETALHLAAAMGNPELVQLLCESRGDIEAADQYGNRPLHRGAAHAEVIRLLLARGARTDAANRDGDYPLHSAAWFGNVRAMRLLVESCAHAPSDAGLPSNADSPSDADSPSKGDLLACVRFVAGTPLVDVEGHQGSTPLAVAALRGHVAAARYLIERAGANVHALDRVGRSALHVAADAGRSELVQCLLFHRAEPTSEVIELLHRATASEVERVDAMVEGQAAAALGLSVAWTDHLVRMLPLTRRLLAFGDDPSAVDASRLILEQATAQRLGCIDTLTKYRGARWALELPEKNAALRVPCALSPEQCAALRQAVDLWGRKSEDSVDRLPNHDLGLSVADLQRIIGAEAMTLLLSLPHRFPRPDLNAVASAQNGTPTFALAGAFARRYSIQTHQHEQPLTSFHFDSAAMTVNVALTSDTRDIEGGRLLGVYGGAVQPILRAEGEATVHSSSLMHGVTLVRRGTRYSLIMFFGSASPSAKVCHS